MTPIRVLLAGFEGLAAQDHQTDMFLPAFRRHPGFDLVGTVGAEGGTTGLPGFADVEAAVGATGAELVSVCLRDPARTAMVRAALDAGADVLVDRPLAQTAEEAAALVAHAAERGRAVIPAYFHRFHPRIRAVRTAIETGRAGLPWSLQADFIVSGGATLPEGEVENFAGFPVDIVQYLLGQPVRRVHAMAGTRFSPGETGPDIAVLHLDHDHEVTSRIVVGRRPGTGSEGLIHRYSVAGSTGILELDVAAPGILVRDARGLTLPDPLAPDLLHAMLDEVSAIVRRVGRPALTGSAAVEVAAVMDAVRESLASGQPAAVCRPDGKRA
jgi:predicted dehydrogenase